MTTYELVGRREEVFRDLLKGPKRPKDVAGDLNINLSHASRALAELKAGGYAAPRVVSSREIYYGLTEKSLELAKRMSQTAK